MFRSRCPGPKEPGAIGAQTENGCNSLAWLRIVKGSRSFSLIRRSAERAYSQLGVLLRHALWIPQTCNGKKTAMEHLDQNTRHRVHPGSLQASPSSQDDVSGFICPDSRMRPVSMRERVWPEGQKLCRLTVTGSRAANMPPRPLSDVLHNFVFDRGSYMKPSKFCPKAFRGRRPERVHMRRDRRAARRDRWKGMAAWTGAATLACCLNNLWLRQLAQSRPFRKGSTESERSASVGTVS
jgi:hypothetical protein